MIVVVDNGKVWSDHRLYFVEADSLKAVEDVLATEVDDGCGEMARPNPQAKVAATSSDLTWLDRRNGTMPFEKFKTDYLDGWI